MWINKAIVLLLIAIWVMSLILVTIGVVANNIHFTFVGCSVLICGVLLAPKPYR